MSTRRPVGRHLDVRAVLDYLESRTDSAGQRVVEEHLGRPCSRCRDLVRELGWLEERMRLDRVPEVPEALRERARQTFVAPPMAVADAPAPARLARLLFDSWQHPLPAATRRSIGEMRRLCFVLGADLLELESESESPDTRAFRGRLQASDPFLHRVEIMVGSERLSTWPDSGGAFAFDRVPLGPARLTVIGPRGRFRIPSLE